MEKVNKKTPLKENKIFRAIIIPFCVVLCFVGIFLPAIGPLPQAAVHVLCVFLGSLILWLTIGIDWPSLLCMFSLAFVRITLPNASVPGETVTNFLGFGEVLKNGFGDATFLFLLFTFICTYALSKTGILKRITLAFINSKLAKKSGLWFSFMFLLSVLLIGLVTSPSVLFVVILAMLNEILEIAGIEKGSKLGKALMMGLGFTVSISSAMTPIAHVFPVLAMNQLPESMSISSGAYMLFAIPAGLIIFLAMFLILFVIYRPEVDKLKNIDTSNLKDKLPKVNKNEIITSVIFLVVIILWVSIDITKSVYPDKSHEFYKLINSFGTVMPPLLGTLALCIIRVDNKPLIKVDEAFKNVPWGSLVMCAATLALGFVLKHDGVGLQAFLKTNISNSVSGLPIVVLLIIFAIWAGLQTNVSSNMVTATLVASVAVAVLTTIPGIKDMEVKSIVAVIGFLASLAFATPPSMPHIAIIGGSEYCTTKDVLIFGGILMVIGISVSCLIGYPMGLLVL